MGIEHDLRARIALANLHHRCAACFTSLAANPPELEAKAIEEARAQGMTDEQIADPTYAAKICDACWEKHGGLRGFVERMR